MITIFRHVNTYTQTIKSTDAQNVDSMIFKEVLHELARRLGYQSKDLIDF